MSCGHHDIAGIYAQTAAVRLFFSPSHLSHTAVIFLRSLILLSAFSLLPLSYNRALFNLSLGNLTLTFLWKLISAAGGEQNAIHNLKFGYLKSLSW